MVSIFSYFSPSAIAVSHVRWLKQAATAAGPSRHPPQPFEQPGNANRWDPANWWDPAQNGSKPGTAFLLLASHSLASQTRRKEPDKRNAHSSKLINFRRLNKDLKINLIKHMLTEFSLGDLPASPAGKHEKPHNSGVQAGHSYTCSGEFEHYIHKPLVRR